jgi:putative transcriptional regulator
MRRSSHATFDFTGKDYLVDLTSKFIIDFTDSDKSSNLTGKFLVASPFIGLNELFNKSLIYVASHRADGAIGFIVNSPIESLSYDIKLPRIFSSKKLQKYRSNLDEYQTKGVEIFLSGPNEPNRAFIMHTNYYDDDLLFKINDEIFISSSLGALENILSRSDPKNSLLLMGYTGWRAGQLEKEMGENLWVVTKGDVNLLFQTHWSLKWSEALKQVGVYEAFFCGQVGHG